MLSCLSNCCPSLFSRTRKKSAFTPLTRGETINYNSITLPTSSNVILTNHQNKLTKRELRASNPAIATSFYSTIPKELCTKEFGKNLIKQIFQSTTNTENNFNLALLCIKRIPANNDIKRALQIETRNIMCSTLLTCQESALRLLKNYYQSIDLTKNDVTKEETKAVLTLGTHPKWEETVTKILNEAIQEQPRTQPPSPTELLANITRDSDRLTQILTGIT